MTVLSKDLDEKVLQALHWYSEYKVARMYNIRVGAVRSIRMEHQNQLKQMDLAFGDSPTGRSISKRNDELLRNAILNTQVHQFNVTDKRKPFIQIDFSALEKRMYAHLAGTTGHALLDTLREHEIYNQQQLIDALNIDKQADSLPVGQALLLARRLLNKVYGSYVNDQTPDSTSV